MIAVAARDRHISLSIGGIPAAFPRVWHGRTTVAIEPTDTQPDRFSRMPDMRWHRVRPVRVTICFSQPEYAREANKLIGAATDRRLTPVVHAN